MEYLEFQFHTADEQTAEILMALLAEQGFDTFTQEQQELNAYIPADTLALEEIIAYISELQQQFVFNWVHKKYADINWNAEWEKNFHPVIIDDRCIIRAPFHEAPENIRYDIIIEPRMSFGTGHHASTYLMAVALLGIDCSGKEMADAGCGTGVLSILAAKKGAAHIYAVDNNEWAYHNAIDNIQLNGVGNSITLALGDLQLFTGRKFDIILANINRSIIYDHIPLFFRCLPKGGLIIVSGILQSAMPLIEERASAYYLQKRSLLTKDDWACAIFQAG
ncbi:MAG: 50S ribosomal protein L11 methyltransferase [Chitinophagales bacterium]